eukprot:CAMPEP_0118652876 /NCGR_PEP_ID=MMETSP0785-20121206/11546_1 /TAXON_ID=91992 /ORGANISM="Bolidomonas pacifica, Strain CCMP 1866" /LENGTH=1434 /DNA_ID=CAMNT_0006545411 /DNA_START=134 /DNA_END=4435 /DNA_ORIENTATION=+
MAPKTASLRKRNKDAEVQDGVKLQFAHAFGVHGPIRDNVMFIRAENNVGDEKEALLFPVGQKLCLYWHEDSEMSFFTGTMPNVCGMLAMATSPNGKFVAVCDKVIETSNSGAQASIYMIKNRKKLKNVVTPPQKECFLNCCFSGDSKMLITVSDGPNRNMIVWDWASPTKPMKYQISLGQTAVTRVSSPLNNPPGVLQLITTGPYHIRVWNISGDNPIKSQVLYKEHDNFVDHCWLTLDGGIQRMAAVTEGTTAPNSNQRFGSILLCQSIDEDKLIEYRRTMTVVLQGNTQIRTIAKSSRGFIVGGTNGFFSVYEKTDDRKDPYMHIKYFYCGRESFMSISANHNDEHAVAYSKTGRLLSFPLGSVDMIDESEAEKRFIDVIPGGTHEGAIIDSSLCAQKPLLATVGGDKSVRLWNYLKWECELTHKFNSDDPTCVSMHPSGIQILVGLRERIRMYNVMVNELKQFRELPLKGCRQLEYSNGGHMFAACVGQMISVYSTYKFNISTGFECLFNYNGHISNVSKVLWSPNDTFMYSTGLDGNVYGWNLQGNEVTARYDEVNILNRACSYTGMVAEFAEGMSKINRIAVCGSENYFLELTWEEGKKDSHVCRQIDIGSADKDCITCLALSNNKKYLFAGTASGNVRTYDWPLDGTNPISQTYKVHHFKVVTGAGGSESYRGVTDMRISNDDNYLFTTAHDGSVFVIGLQVVERGLDTKPSLVPHDSQFQLDAILVSQEEVEKQLEDVENLQKELDEQKMESEKTLHMETANWQKEFKDMQEDGESKLTAERSRYETLQEQFEAHKREQREKFELEETNHVQITQELENQFEHKLAVEMERFDRLAEEIEAMQQKCEGLLEAQEKDHRRNIHRIEMEKAKESKELNMMITRMKEDEEHNNKMYREVLEQQETEYEMELQKLMSAAEADLKTEQDSTRKMQGVVQEIRTKREQEGVVMTNLKKKSLQHEKEYAKEKARRVKLEDTLKHVELHLKEREDALSDKEKTILGLRSTNRTLDNFRYVLDHRLQQLMKERGPISKHIEGLEKHVRSMYDELVVEFQKKKDNSRVLEQKELKIKTLTKEVTASRNTSRALERELTAIKREITAMVGTTQTKELDSIVKDAYRKFVRGEKDLAAGGRGGRRTSNASSMAGSKKKTGVVTDETAKVGDDDALYGEGGVGQSRQLSMDEVELAEKAMEAQRQTQWVQKTAKDLKRRLRVEQSAADRNQRNKLAENTALVGECNTLRRENAMLRREKEVMVHEISEYKETLKRKSVREEASVGSLGMGSVVENIRNLPPQGYPETPETIPVSGTQMKVSKSLEELKRGRSGGNQGEISAQTLPNMGGTGRLMKGSGSRAVGSSTSMREDIVNLQKKLDERQRETEMQRIEINRLRETVRVMALEQKPVKKPHVLPGTGKKLYNNLEGGNDGEGSLGST